MAIPPFAVTWDYRCPFARNAHEHVVTALGAGAPWDVRFVPFSLDQVHVESGSPDVWDNPARRPALLAMQAGIVVRELMPRQFPSVHLALFRARHDEGQDLRDEPVVRRVLTSQGVDADEVLGEIGEGWPLETFRKEHDHSVTSYSVFGVPTFIAGDRAVFVRLADRPAGDADRARTSIERVVGLLVGWPELNEFKHTTLPG